MHLARKTILHLLEIIGLDESSPYLINKLKDEKIDRKKEELKKQQQRQQGNKLYPDVVAVVFVIVLICCC